MKTVFHYGLIALVMVLFFGCGNEEDPTPPIPHVEKTVFMFFPWTASETSSQGNLYSYIRRNITDTEKAIQEQNGLGTTRLFVSLAQKYGESKLFEIVYSSGKCEEIEKKTYQTSNISLAEQLAQQLEDVHELSPTGITSMIVGAHGTGWLPKDYTPSPRKAFGGVSEGTRANIQELVDVISHSTIKHLEFLCFDDCYMANIETAYNLRQVTDYYLASTSEVIDIGLPYYSVWKYLAQHTDYTAVCREFLTFYNQYKYPYGTFSAIYCPKTEKLAELMLQVNQESVLSPENYEKIQVLDGITPTVFFDFYDYVEKLNPSAQRLKEIRECLDEVVVAKANTKYIYTVLIDKGSTIPVNTFSGITISDPTRHTALTEALHQTEWWKATHLED